MSQPPSNPGQEPQRGTTFGVTQILTGILVIALLGVGAFYIWQNAQKDAALAVGNCLVITGELDDADHEPVDCEDRSVSSQYVGEVVDGGGECSDPFAAPYTTSDTTSVTCLIPQLFEGQCYAQLPAEAVNDLEPVDCSDKDLEVISVVDESGAQCDEGSEPIDFLKPARTYCIVFQD